MKLGSQVFQALKSVCPITIQGQLASLGTIDLRQFSVVCKLFGQRDVCVQGLSENAEIELVKNSAK